MFDDILKSVMDLDGKVKLNEVLTKSQISKMRNELATPEITPCDFDQTIEGWLARIELWGSLVIKHVDPENFRGKKKISQNQFVARLADTTSLHKAIGTWTIKKDNMTKVSFYRDYIGLKNKHYVEKFIVSVKLRPELR